MIDIVFPVSLKFSTADVIFDAITIFLIGDFVPLTGVAGPVFINVERSFDELVIFNIAKAVIFAMFTDRTPDCTFHTLRAPLWR
jgi:hypothetical protein